MKKMYLLAVLSIFVCTVKTVAQVTPAGTLTGNGNLVKVDPSAISPEIKNLLNYYDKQVYFTHNDGQWDSKILYSESIQKPIDK